MSTKELNYATTITALGSIDTIIGFFGIGEALDAEEIIAFKMVISGILNHFPLDNVLGVVVHQGFMRAREKGNDLVAIGEKHGGGKGGNFAIDSGFSKNKLYLIAKKLIHVLVIFEVAIMKVATL